MLEYNDENLKKVTELILKNLSSDLLPRSWLDKNEVNLTFGHCHNSAGCLYKIFGSKAVNMYRGFDGEIYHWWVQDKAGKIIDKEDLMYARPANEFNSNELLSLIGKVCSSDIAKGHKITKKNILI